MQREMAFQNVLKHDEIQPLCRRYIGIGPSTVDLGQRYEQNASLP